MNRRQFIGRTSVLAGAAVLGGTEACRRTPKCPVTLLGMADYSRDVAKDVAAAFAADGLALKGKKVLLKPNFVEVHPDRPVNTHPAVIANVAEACLRIGASEVVVGEAPGHRRDPWHSVLHPALRSALDPRVRRLDLNHGRAAAVPNKGGRSGVKGFFVAAPALEADVVISLPKLKTHHWTGLTLSLKNMFGVLPGIHYGWPKNPLHFAGIENSILDLARTLPPHYAVIDGVVGMEGDGPIMGRPKAVGVLVLSRYPLAADAVAARVMGFEPERVPYLVGASRFLPGIEERAIEHRGEPEERFATAFACVPEFRMMLREGR